MRRTPLIIVASLLAACGVLLVIGALVVLGFTPPSPLGASQTGMSPDVVPEPTPGSTMVQAETLPQGVDLLVDDVSGMASDANPIFMASTRNAWNPGDSRQRLTRESATTWRISLPYDPSQTEVLQFKFTLGSWDRVEVDSGGFSIRNRVLSLVDSAGLGARRPVMRMSVARFLRAGETENLGRDWTPRVSSGRVELVRVRGGGGRAKDLERDLFVWLPVGYDSWTKPCSVLFLLDGQNVLEKNATTTGEWQVDETMTRLLADGKIPPAIVVGIPHAGRYRADEYWPYGDRKELYRNETFWGAEALLNCQDDPEGFRAFVRDVCVPAIRAKYRVSTQASGTFIGGADLGGTMAYYLASRERDLFGGAIVESMWLPWGDGYDRVSAERLFAGFPSPGRLVLGFGDQIGYGANIVGTKPQGWLDELIKTGDVLGTLAISPPDAVFYSMMKDTDDSEVGWSKRFPQNVHFLLEATGTPAEQH